MKKILLLLALTVIIATGCKSESRSAEAKKLVSNDTSFYYSAHTRGTIMNISINENDIIAAKGRPQLDTIYPTAALKGTDWDILLRETDKLNLEKLETLEAPTKKHQHDGAMAATLKITVDGKEYQTVTFDHGNPPAEIKPLVDKIIELSELEKK